MFSPTESATTIFTLFQVATQKVCKDAVRVPLIKQAGRIHKKLCAVESEINALLAKSFLSRFRLSRRISVLKEQLNQLKDKFFSWIVGSVNAFGLSAGVA